MSLLFFLGITSKLFSELTIAETHIFTWLPTNLKLSVSGDSTHNFVFSPINNDSDLVFVKWYVDGLNVEADNTRFKFKQYCGGVHQIMVRARIGNVIDIIRWEVDVMYITYLDSMLMTTTDQSNRILISSFPTPFGGIDPLYVYLPISGSVGLTIYNNDGDVVLKKNYNFLSKGHHNFIDFQFGLDSGIYIAEVRVRGLIGKYTFKV